MEQFIKASNALNEQIVSLSLGGLGTILLVWSAHYGLKNDWNLKGFKYTTLLIFPFTLFLFAFLFLQVQYYSAVAGYRWEVLHGFWKNDGKHVPITNGETHFLEQYADMVQAASRWSLLASIVAVCFLAFWFAWNVLKLRKGTL